MDTPGLTSTDMKHSTHDLYDNKTMAPFYTFNAYTERWYLLPFCTRSWLRSVPFLSSDATSPTTPSHTEIRNVLLTAYLVAQYAP